MFFAVNSGLVKAVQIQGADIGVHDFKIVPPHHENRAGIIVKEQSVGLFGLDQFLFQDLQVGNVGGQLHNRP